MFSPPEAWVCPTLDEKSAPDIERRLKRWILNLPKKYGGTEMRFLELAVLLEEMARACLPGPFFSTVVLGALPILEFGTDAQKQAYLPGISAGKIIFTLALTEPSAGYDAA